MYTGLKGTTALKALRALLPGPEGHYRVVPIGSSINVPQGKMESTCRLTVIFSAMKSTNQIASFQTATCRLTVVFSAMKSTNQIASFQTAMSQGVCVCCRSEW